MKMEMKELLIRYIEGNCTDHEKVEVTKWLDSDPGNMKEYLAMRKLHDILIWQTNQKINLKQKSKIKTFGWRNPIYSEFLKIAAVFIIAIILSHYLLPKHQTESPVAIQTLHVPAGQRAEITLEDGTKVWLNAKTTLKFPNKFSTQTREVKLDGEGYFEVAHNKSRPFIVSTDKYNVKVLGTKFNLMAYSDKGNFETSLLEGSVEILKPGIDKGVLIHPNEKIHLEENRLVISPIGNLNHFLWKDGIVSFDNETFPEMVKKLELYFDLKIFVKNDKIVNYRCTGKFRTKDGVEHILKVLKLKNEFIYEIDYKRNIITIE